MEIDPSPRDSACAYFAMWERSVRLGDEPMERYYLRKLKRLGVQVFVDREKMLSAPSVVREADDGD